MKAMHLFALTAALVLALATGARADWDDSMDHKMHFPQHPDPNGWDVNISGYTVADDWKCSATGDVRDIHFWGSWAGDMVGNITNIHASIHADIPDPDGTGPLFSMPGTLLWEEDFAAGTFTVKLVGTGTQGWYNPGDVGCTWPDHQQYFQVNITNITNPYQQQKDTIYWLDLIVTVSAYDFGWKTTYDLWNDDAVYLDASGLWQELIVDGVSQHMAFVITPEPATLTFVALGLAGLVARRRRRR